MGSVVVVVLPFLEFGVEDVHVVYDDHPFPGGR